MKVFKDWHIAVWLIQVENMIGISAFILLMSFCLWYLIKTVLWVNRAANMTANIPGPKPLPIIGNALLFTKIRTLEGLFTLIVDLMKENCIPPDNIGKLWYGTKLAICLGNPTHIKAVLSSQDALQKDPMYEFFGIFGNGLLVRNGREWQELRKPLDKLLTKKMIESNIDVFNEKALKFCEVLNKYAETGKVFNVKHYVANFAVDSLSVSSFGYNLDELENEKHDLTEVSERIMENVVKYMVQFPSKIGANYTSVRLRKYVKPLWDAVNEMLQGRMEIKKLLGEELGGQYTYYSDVLIEKAIKDKLSLDATGRLAADFLIAGYDTSTVTMSHILLLLAMFPKHQEAVYQEQLDICGDDPEVVPTWEQLSKMDYLTRVVKDVLRLYSPPAILRKLTSDIDLGQYKLPEGASVYISFYTLHRNPDFWSHPDEFYPDHFLPQECAKRSKDCFFPFSWGPRSCPGSVYAMIINKVLISTAIRKYKFETDLKFEEILIKYSLLLEVSQGYLIRIKRRISESN